MAEANGNGDKPRIIQPQLTLGSLINLCVIVAGAVTATIYVDAIKSDGVALAGRVDTLQNQVNHLDQDIRDLRSRLLDGRAP